VGERVRTRTPPRRRRLQKSSTVKHDDETEVEIGPTQAYVIEPGHDAWVLGDEGFVGFEFES